MTKCVGLNYIEHKKTLFSVTFTTMELPIVITMSAVVKRIDSSTGAVNAHNSNSDSFQRYSRSKSKIVAKRTKFSTFLPFQILRGGASQKLYPRYPYLAARHVDVAKFHELLLFQRFCG